MFLRPLRRLSADREWLLCPEIHEDFGAFLYLCGITIQSVLVIRNIQYVVDIFFRKEMAYLSDFLVMIKNIKTIALMF